MSRPVGSKNKRTEQWEKLGKWMTNKGAKRMMEVMRNMNDEEFAKHFLQLARYFRPTLSSASIKSEGDINVSVISDDKDVLNKI